MAMGPKNHHAKGNSPTKKVMWTKYVSFSHLRPHQLLLGEVTRQQRPEMIPRPAQRPRGRFLADLQVPQALPDVEMLWGYWGTPQDGCGSSIGFPSNHHKTRGTLNKKPHPYGAAPADLFVPEPYRLRQGSSRRF